MMEGGFIEFYLQLLWLYIESRLAIVIPLFGTLWLTGKTKKKEEKDGIIKEFSKKEEEE